MLKGLEQNYIRLQVMKRKEYCTAKYINGIYA
nr:MAG TPA: hypothetical protein [Caudoviricetes sp.]